MQSGDSARYGEKRLCSDWTRQPPVVRGKPRMNCVEARAQPGPRFSPDRSAHRVHLSEPILPILKVTQFGRSQSWQGPAGIDRAAAGARIVRRILPLCGYDRREREDQQNRTAQNQLASQTRVQFLDEVPNAPRRHFLS